MANYKVPRVVEIVDALPLNATGKVMKDVAPGTGLRPHGRRRPMSRRTGWTCRTEPAGLTALTGLRVVEMGVWVAAPSAGALLADWGADVIKVEPPNGDPMRSAFGSLGIGQDFPNPAFAQDNRGKRSVVLDLREPEAQERLEELLVDGRRLPHQPAPRRARRPRPRAGGHGRPPSAARLLQRQRVRPARRGPQPAGLRHRRLLGPLRPLGPAGQQRGRARSTRAAASATTSAGWPRWPASWPPCSSNARPDAGASSRCRCCGPGPTCSGGTSACRRPSARWPSPRRGTPTRRR